VVLPDAELAAMGSAMPDVVVVGAGIVGAACAYYAARAGCDVTVLERGRVANGTSSRGEGNILLSDKGPGPDLELQRLSSRLWTEIGDDRGPESFELEHKGGLVLASSEAGMQDLAAYAHAQTQVDIGAEIIAREQLLDREPNLAPDMAGGVFYPQDMQVQPIMALVELLRGARAHGARVITGVEVTGIVRDKAGKVASVQSSSGVHRASAVVNATGPWAGELSAAFGAEVPVMPRRGFVLVTEPLPPVVRHKVYTADYMANVASSEPGLETSVVIEGTRGGTVLIGASRERVGFDPAFSVDVVRRLAAQAVRVFPFLASVHLMRVYRGFRPYTPDHLPLIGPDDRVPGLFHACGHEGEGIGLAPATGLLVSQMLTGQIPEVDVSAFDPARLRRAHA
jgi:glycine/D-amino acid oxidase-like deaminating enzyme